MIIEINKVVNMKFAICEKGIRIGIIQFYSFFLDEFDNHITYKCYTAFELYLKDAQI
jgi:hypothetical protein